ncbi:MAG: hypothetical protein IKQ55_08670 [Kiritimatiellae bacterium]|nr:hypothetical protein [Kiritimatiellia bacterium]
MAESGWGGFSNDWKKVFQWLEKSGRVFQRLEKFFGVFPMIGKKIPVAAKTAGGAKWRLTVGGGGGYSGTQDIGVDVVVSMKRFGQESLS